MFKINNLNVSVNDKNILNDLNVELPDGQIHVIMGKNGIGKDKKNNRIKQIKDKTAVVQKSKQHGKKQKADKNRYRIAGERKT